MATDTVRSAPRPPGSAGLPGIGETLEFVKDPFAFIEKRRARHGRVFRTSLLGKSMAILVGLEPLEAFNDPANIVREGANPPNIQTLFGGTGVINAIDGAAHASRKRFVSAALSRDAIETYLPTMTRFVDAAFARWTTAGEIGWNDELKRLVIETLGAVLANIESDADLAALVKRCEAIAAAFIALPIPLPGTAYTKGVRAKDESIAYYRELVRAHRAGSYDDGLSRILAARDADGTTIGDAEAAGELNHLFLAGFIVFGQFASTIAYLKGAGGPETHRCPGYDLTTIFMALFAAQLVRGYSWTLAEQDLTPNWGLVPPVPRDGLRAVVRPLAAAPVAT